MINFEFRNPTKIIFGKGAEQKLGAEILRHGKKALVHYGGGSIKKNGVYDKVIASLKSAGVEYVELGGVKPNPRLSLVHEGIRLCRDEGVDFILAVGGGSAIDSAKAIAVGIPYEGDVWDFYSGDALPKSAYPVGAVLTLAAAGSESSWGSVITKDDEMLKRALDNELIYPVFSILNPEFTYSLPAYQTSCGISDILAHMMERYFTNVKSVGITDRLLEGAMKNIIDVGAIALQKPDDYDIRSEIMLSGCVAHNNSLDIGRVGDWASHMIEHELSGFNDVAHGAGLSVVFPAWMKYVYKHDIRLFTQFAVRVWGEERDFLFFDDEKTILRAITKMEDFFKSLGLPVRLSELGIRKKDFRAIAQKCKVFDEEAGTVGNFVKLTKDDIVKILELAE